MSDQTDNTKKILTIIGYITGSIMSIALLGFSIYKLAVEPDSQLWLSILVSIVSLYIPSPIQITDLFKGKDDNNSSKYII